MTAINKENVYHLAEILREVLQGKNHYQVAAEYGITVQDVEMAQDDMMKLISDAALRRGVPHAFPVEEYEHLWTTSTSQPGGPTFQHSMVEVEDLWGKKDIILSQLPVVLEGLTYEVLRPDGTPVVAIDPPLTPEKVRALVAKAEEKRDELRRELNRIKGQFEDYGVIASFFNAPPPTVDGIYQAKKRLREIMDEIKELKRERAILLFGKGGGKTAREITCMAAQLGIDI